MKILDDVTIAAHVPDDLELMLDHPPTGFTTGDISVAKQIEQTLSATVLATVPVRHCRPRIASFARGLRREMLKLLAIMLAHLAVATSVVRLQARIVLPLS
jgi:hypothetical protein